MRRLMWLAFLVSVATMGAGAGAVFVIVGYVIRVLVAR